MFGLESIDASGTICVSANPIGVGPPIPVTGLTGVNGSFHASGVSIFGNPLAFPIPMGNVMITRSADIKLKVAPMLWVRGFPDSPPTATDVTIGDPAGIVGISINSFLINILNATRIDIVSPFTNGVGILNWVGAKTLTGTVSETGAEARAGAEAVSGKTVDNGDKNVHGPLEVSGPVTAIDVKTAKVGSLNAKSSYWDAKKSFDIQHPSKPNHRLRYICLEGPTADVYLRGKLVNKSYIQLPDYWKNFVDMETLVINLTPNGHWQELFVDKIEWGDKIIIKNNSGSEINCNYVIYGERIDTSKNISEYKGLTPADYPGDNREYNINGN